MVSQRKWIIWTLCLITLASFILFMIPNSKASENKAIIQVFEPDEVAPLDYLTDMIDPAENLKAWIIDFVFYGYYFYGFPFFGASALILLPLQWTGNLYDWSTVLLVLRQVISVLPMLISLLLLVYMQDKFRTYRSIILYLFLLIVPAIIRNGFWWHPDGLVLLLSVLVIFFLWKDQLAFGWRFFIAAGLIGILTAIKMVGPYFFLAVGLVILWGYFTKKISFKQVALYSASFIIIMIAAFIVFNPFLISRWGREAYINTFQRQTGYLSQGYGIIYLKGLRAAWPTLKEYYGEAIFILFSIFMLLYDVIKKNNLLLNSIILAWFIPLTITTIFVFHFKFQYWLPVAIPMFSSLLFVFPEKASDIKFKDKRILFYGIGITIFVFQFVLFSKQAIISFQERNQRAKNNEIIQFYSIAKNELEPINPNKVYVYYDYRLYVPETPGWILDTSYDLLSYDYILSQDFDVLLLLEQRIRDYLNPNAEGVEPEQFKLSQVFYQDAFDGEINHYSLIFRNETALIFIKNEICQLYFPQEICE